MWVTTGEGEKDVEFAINTIITSEQNRTNDYVFLWDTQGLVWRSMSWSEEVIFDRQALLKQHGLGSVVDPLLLPSALYQLQRRKKETKIYVVVFL